MSLGIYDFGQGWHIDELQGVFLLVRYFQRKYLFLNTLELHIKIGAQFEFRLFQQESPPFGD